MNAQPRHSITFALTAVFAAMWAVAAADEPLQPQANAATAGLRGRIVRLAKHPGTGAQSADLQAPGHAD